MIELTLNNKTKYKLPSRKFIQHVISESYRLSLGDIPSKTIVSLSVNVVGPDRMRRLNREFRRINKATDVLSFPVSDTSSSSYGIIILGDLFLCPEIAQKKAKALGIAWPSEVGWLLVHGFLHLIGYDHERSPKSAKEMERLEQKILKKLGLK